jgi:Domain of unknown function (DUF4160)
MPTILRVDDVRVCVWSHEPNEPPHVHLGKGGVSAKVWLDPVRLATNAGFVAHDLAVILRLVRDHQPLLPEAGHAFSGTG